MTKTNNKTLVIVIAAVVALVIGVIAYNNYASVNRYSVQDYIYDIQFSGENGEGVVLVPNVNYRAMNSLAFDQAYNLSDVMDTVTYTASPNEGLSNGDKVKMHAYYDETMGRNRGIKLTNLSWTVEVQGLGSTETGSMNTSDQHTAYLNTSNVDISHTDVSDENSGYKVGSVYTVQDVLRVRENPDINARHIKREELVSEDYTNSVDYPDALLQKGTKVKCLEMSGNWMRISSGWICVNDGKEVLVK